MIIDSMADLFAVMIVDSMAVMIIDSVDSVADK